MTPEELVMEFLLQLASKSCQASFVTGMQIWVKDLEKTKRCFEFRHHMILYLWTVAGQLHRSAGCLG